MSKQFQCERCGVGMDDPFLCPKCDAPGTVRPYKPGRLTPGTPVDIGELKAFAELNKATEPTYRLDAANRAYRDGHREGFKCGHRQGTMFAVQRLLDLDLPEAATKLAKSFAKSAKPVEIEPEKPVGTPGQGVEF